MKNILSSLIIIFLLFSLKSEAQNSRLQKRTFSHEWKYQKLSNPNGWVVETDITVFVSFQQKTDDQIEYCREVIIYPIDIIDPKGKRYTRQDVGSNKFDKIKVEFNAINANLETTSGVLLTPFNVGFPVVSQEKPSKTCEMRSKIIWHESHARNTLTGGKEKIYAAYDNYFRLNFKNIEARVSNIPVREILRQYYDKGKKELDNGNCNNAIEYFNYFVSIGGDMQFLAADLKRAKECGGSVSNKTNGSNTKTTTKKYNSNKSSKKSSKKEKTDKEVDSDVDYSKYRRKRIDPTQRQIQAINQFSNNLRQIGNQFSALISDSFKRSNERKEKERQRKYEKKQIEEERIANRKKIEKQKRIAEDKRLNKLKKIPEYVAYVKKALSDVFYFDSSGKEVDQKNATYEAIYEKQDNGFYIAKYFNLKEQTLDFDISYEIIPNPYIESLKTGSSIKYGTLNTKIETQYYYRNKLKQKTINLWWKRKIHFEFYNYKDEKVFASGEISNPEIMNVSPSGIITKLWYKVTSKRKKFKRYRFTFDAIGNLESLYISNEKHRIENRYKFDQ